jgi:hypothetical protein
LDEVQAQGRRDPGVIAWLTGVIDDHRSAIEFDLIKLGLRLRYLGTDLLTWRDLFVIVQNTFTDTALYRAMNPDSWQWSLSEHLLAVVADATIFGNWMRSKDGRRNRNRPKPIARPGQDTGEKTYGDGALDIGEMREWLGWNVEPSPPDKKQRARDARGRFVKTT